MVFIVDILSLILVVSHFVILQECFNCPYGTQYFKEYAEPVPGNSTQTLAAAAKENNVFVVGGMYETLLSFCHALSFNKSI